MRTIAAVAVCVLVASVAIAAGHEDLWARYQKGDAAGVLEPVRAGLAATPDDPDLNLLLGRALADTGRLDQAREPLERAIALDADHSFRTAWALAYLGRVQLALGSKSAARRSFEKVIAMQATQNATSYARQWMRIAGMDPFFDGWAVRESPHFVFHFAPSLPAKEFDAYADAHEKAFDAIVKFFGAPPARKIDFFVWGDPEVERTKIILGFARPEVAVVHAHAKQTVGHEMTHVIAWSVAHPKHETGIINEGAAVCFDQTVRDRMAGARELVANSGSGAVTVGQLWGRWKEVPGDVAYAVAGAFVQHLIATAGRERFLELLADQTEENARAVYGDDLPRIIAAFERDLTAAK